MAATGRGTLLASGPDKDQAGVSGAEGVQEAHVKVCQEREGAQRTALLEQAEEAAARLKELIAKLGVVGVTPLVETEPQMVVLEARLAPAAEYLITAGEDLLSAATQSDSARKQMLRAEAHLSFAKLHMAATQKFQTPTEEVGAPLDKRMIPARAQLVKVLTEAREFEVTTSDPQARCQWQWVRVALCRAACVSPSRHVK
jgi:hypothetical protein